MCYCEMVVFRGKDLVEHHKLVPRREQGVYLGTGKQFGRRAFMCYSARLNQVLYDLPVWIVSLMQHFPEK